MSASLAPSLVLLVLAEPGTTQTAGTNRPEPGLDTPRPVVHTVEQFDKLCIYHETAASGFFVFGIFRRHPADATSPLSFLWLTMIAYACTYGDRPVVFLAPYVTFAVVDVSGRAPAPPPRHHATSPPINVISSAGASVAAERTASATPPGSRAARHADHAAKAAKAACADRSASQ